MADDQIQETAKDRLFSKMKGRKPDANWDENPDGVYDELEAYDGEREEKLKRSEDNDSKLRGMFLDNPEISGVFSDISAGTHPAVAFITHYGEGIMAAKEDPEVAEQFTKAQQAYMDKLSSSKDIEGKQEANFQKSLELLGSFTQEKQMSDTEAEGFFEKIMTTVDGVFMMDWTRELLEIFWKGLCYDTDLKDAHKEGVATGRNEKITAKSKKDLGDGLPQLPSAPETPTEAPKQFGRTRRNMFDS